MVRMRFLHLYEKCGKTKKKLQDFSRSFFVRVAGLEPATYWFVASCAIQLRHIRICDDPNIELAKHLSRGLHKIFFIFLLDGGSPKACKPAVSVPKS